ncbi:hypothetical protein [Synechococcus sp. MIT S9504]|uniref:hypothetical protein n=1 Tax=Synechococcus sp. MIT S9504 TaxID=1801628 RepID=UPI0007BB8062|nr:hypothetical protein [Synechococcus sp. MIT S9504]KZR82253.1 hypothetical protein MITS9504_03503 [Synechococcus sp. MIT S9504]
MDIVVKGERAVVGDCVLLSCGDSERSMSVHDVDGCQIRLDGEVKSIERDWCKVLVQAEESSDYLFGDAHKVEECGVNREGACMEQGECKAD